MLAGVVRESSNQYINERMGKLKDLARESIHGKNMRFSGPKTMMRKQTKKKQQRKLRNHDRSMRTPKGMKTQRKI